MELSVIIVNFNTNHFVLNCISSIQLHLKEVQHEIILVDNAPKKENNGSLFQDMFPDIIYLFSQQNIGFGPANNLGIKIARGKYLLLINSDTLVFDDSIQKCLHFMEKPESANIGLLGCKLLNGDKSYQPSFFPFVKNSLWNFLCTNNLVFYKLFKIGERYKETDQVSLVGDISGAFMLVRSEVVAKVGAFDPDFFLYCEETEWCRERINKMFDIVYYPMASIIHYGGKSAPKELMLIQSKLSLSLVWYKKGLFNYIGFILITFFNILTNLFTIAFVGRDAKKHAWSEIYSFICLLPYFIFVVPKYMLLHNNRKHALIYKKAQGVFFNNS